MPTKPAGTLYRGKVGMWSWVLHRITGVAIFFFLLVHVLDTSLVRLSPEALVIFNTVPDRAHERVARWGERFHRPPGAEQTGSGLGASIVQRVAQLHGLHVQVLAPDEQHVSVRLSKA